MASAVTQRSVLFRLHFRPGTQRCTEHRVEQAAVLARIDVGNVRGVDGLARRQQAVDEDGDLDRIRPVASEHYDARPDRSQYEVERAAVEFPARPLIARVSGRIIVDKGSARVLRRDQAMYPMGERRSGNRVEILIGKRIAPQDSGRPLGHLLAAETAICPGRLLGGVRVSETLIPRRAGSSRQFGGQ